MINVIYGEKGTGKTKRMVDSANESAKSAKGVVVYFDRTSDRMHDLDRAVRLVDASHYDICSQRETLAFLKGMLAANYDIEHIYIDGIAKFLGLSIDDLGEFYAGLEKISEDFNLEVTITASCSKENLPPFVSKLVK